MDYLPKGFGQEGPIGAAAQNDVYTKYERSGFKETKTDVKSEDGADDSNSDSDESDDSDEEGKEQFPISHEFPLKGHSKKINSVCFAKSGNRLYTSAMDFNFNIFDFNSMNPLANTPFHSSEIYETKPIIKLDVNKKNEVLVIPNDLSFKVLDSNGDKLKEFREGDRYIYDVKRTRGHTDTLTDGCWNPLDDTKLATSSFDSTFRIWDLVSGSQERVNFIKYKGKKTKISKLLYTNSSKNIITTDDHSRLCIWDLNGNLNRPSKELELSSSNIITSINVNSTDENSLLVRTTNNDLKLYDLRNFTTPVIQRLDFPTFGHNSATYYEGQYILAGTSFENKDKHTELHILDKSDLFTLDTLSFDSTISSLDWNKTINQIAIGTDSGSLNVLFSPDISKNGVKLSINNKPKKRHFDENENFSTSSTSQVGYNMTELAELNKNKKKKNQNDDDDDKDTKSKPKMIWGTTNGEKAENNIGLEDPREALMKYSNKK